MTFDSSEVRSSSVAALSSTTTATLPVHAEASLPLRVPTPKDEAAAREFGALLAQEGLLRDFVVSYNELESYKSGAPIPLTGGTLTLPAVAAVARYPGLVSDAIVQALDDLAADPIFVADLERSRRIIDDKLAQNKSIYGVSTGFGGSADTRTPEFDALGLALLQHQHSGVLPSSLATTADANAASSSKEGVSTGPLPLSAPLSTLSMPPTWTRAALLIRLNSLLRGHSAASLPLVRSMAALLAKGITPIVPLRGSISASGDLSPLSYIAGPSSSATGADVQEDGAYSGMRILRAPDALKAHGIAPISLRPKEHLAVLNGTAFSCGLAALCVEESRQMVLLGTVCTALGVEAMRGSADSFCEFIQRVRPHPGQVENGALLAHLLAPSSLASHHLEPVSHSAADSGKDAVYAEAAEEETIDADAGTLRQDRYPLRTAPQWLGPQAELVQRAAEIIKIECNSTTDNPLIDPETGIVHHGGNFQAMAVTTAMEPLRLALFHVGKLLFAQSTELLNSGMNGGLAGNLAATDPSLNFFGKGLDIAQAAYVAELAYLANPVSTGVQSAEMHNQAVNSLALISARYTIQALDVLQILTASYLLLLCQAVDLRALQIRLEAEIRQVVSGLLSTHFGDVYAQFNETSGEDAKKVADTVWSTFDSSSGMDSLPRTEKAARASTQPLIDFLLSPSAASASSAALARLPEFQRALGAALYDAHSALTRAFLCDTSAPGAPDYLPALPLLGRTRAVYTFIRGPAKDGGLGIGMHGRENLSKFAGGLSRGAWEDERAPEERGRTVGGEVSVIYEAIRDGKMAGVLVGMFESA
ncbi:hypothetical protein M0805_009561 [Coniferiporia weirii]|nr:hypothetical protein M0805_009561 [Coniferiporia weirii]